MYAKSTNALELAKLLFCSSNILVSVTVVNEECYVTEGFEARGYNIISHMLKLY